MNKLDSELVSIIIVTHNRVDLLKNAIFSCVNQSYNNIEIIIVDDYSQDNTEGTVKELKNIYSNINYIRLEKASGANIARNAGITMAKGYYITGLDDDDQFESNRVSELVNAYNDNFAYVFSRVFFVYPDKKVKKYFLYLRNILTLNDMLYTNYTGNQILTTKEMFIKAGLYDEKLVSAQDYDMWLKLLLIKPKALLIKNATMNIDKNDDIKRISNSNKRIKGYFQIYKKYKKYMTTSQKKFQLFKLLLEKEKKLTAKVFFRHLSYGNLFLYLYLCLKNFKKR